jgi:N-acetylmuramoyl-L-alanine amidase
MRVNHRPSPNHGPRPGPVDMLVLHYTGMRSAEAALERLCSPEAAVSAHYLIAEDGAVWRHVDEARRAWHAGSAHWAGERDINSRSIGIELANPGHEFGYRRFPEAQMAALEALCRDVLARHPIPARHVLGHSDVAPQRKQDPGELFDWPRLARAGIGLWPAASMAPAPASLGEAQRLLAAIGYATPRSGTLDAATMQVIAAFQRHFRPSCCDGMLDAETGGRIAAVAALCGEI